MRLLTAAVFASSLALSGAEASSCKGGAEASCECLLGCPVFGSQPDKCTGDKEHEKVDQHGHTATRKQRMLTLLRQKHPRVFECSRQRKSNMCRHSPSIGNAAVRQCHVCGRARQIPGIVLRKSNRARWKVHAGLGGRGGRCRFLFVEDLHDPKASSRTKNGIGRERGASKNC